MALQLAPWLQPPNYLESINQGAQLGLGVRKADLEQAAQVQRARQAQAELQQDWATSMLNNQRMTDQNNLVAQSRLDTLGFNRQTQLETNAHNQSMEDIQAFNATKPGLMNIGGAGYDNRTGKLVVPSFETSFTPGPPVDIGNGVQVYQTSRNQWRTVPKADPWATPQNTTPFSSPSAGGVGIDPGSEVAPLPMSNPSTPSPAAGTMGLPPTNEARAFANGLINNGNRNPAAVKARFKAVYGEDL